MFIARSSFTGAPGAPGTHRRVRWAFTDALGDAAEVALPSAGREGTAGAAGTAGIAGIVEPAYGAFNLGAHVGDDPAAVATNRQRLLEAFGASQVVYMNQVHGSDVAVVDGSWPGEPAAVDALVTTRPGVALAVMVADCVPVLLADPAAGIVGAAHAGRKGMTAGLVTATVERMRGLGADRIQAAIGPSICGRCYEVPRDMRDEAAAVRPVSASVTWHGTPGIDVGAGVADELVAAGVEITWVPGCTLENEALYSYRRNPRTGRFAGVVVIDGEFRNGACGEAGGEVGGEVPERVKAGVDEGMTS